MLYQRGGIWWYKFKFAGRLVRESTKSSSTVIARRSETKRQRDLEESYKGLRKRTVPVPFAVAVDAWLKVKEGTLAPRSVAIEKANLGHLKPVFGAMLLQDIRPEDVSRYQGRRLKACASPKTINLEIGTLRAVLRKHRLWADLQPDIRMLATRHDVGKAITLDEQKALLDACGASRSKALLPVVTLALNTGMRYSELLTLRWKQVDLTARQLTVGKSKTVTGSGRVLPLNDTALKAVENWAKRFPKRKPEHFVFVAERYGLAGNDELPHAYRTNPRKHVKSLKEAWETAKEVSNVKCRFHDLRHTAVTRMLEGAAPLSVVATIMGWSAATTVRMARRYGHIGNAAQRQAVDLLPNGS